MRNSGVLVYYLLDWIKSSAEQPSLEVEIEGYMSVNAAGSTASIAAALNVVEEVNTKIMGSRTR